MTQIDPKRDILTRKSLSVVGNVLIPPKAVDRVMQHWDGEEMTVEELKERLEPLMGDMKPQEL